MSCCWEEGFVTFGMPQEKGMRKQSLQWGLQVLTGRRHRSLAGQKQKC